MPGNHSKKLWQRSYHEHIIRNEDRLKTISRGRPPCRPEIY
jgi:hypothetical protein